MLTIRPDQLETFAADARRDFERRAVSHLRASLPRPPAEAELARMTRAAIAKAELYGIRDELATLRYLNAMVLLGPDFDTDPKLAWAGDILRDADFSGTTKMAMLKDLIAQHLAGRT